MEEHKKAWWTSDISPEDTEWNTTCDMLLEYCRQYGSCNVPSKMSCRMPNGDIVPVGRWLNDQRRSQDKMKNQSRNRLQSLENEGKLHLELKVSENVNDEKWNQYYSLMIQYGDTHNGDCNVPQKYSVKMSDGTSVRLGIWLRCQREHKKRNDPRMTKERVSKLQALVDDGRLLWDFDEERDGRWERTFSLLLEYGANHDGDCNVPQKYSVEIQDGTTIKLGFWLNHNHQRVFKRTNHSSLTQERKLKLQSLVNEGKLRW